MYFFLQAFRIPADLIDATLALSAQSASTLLPLTPGGLGTQQALLGYMFRNAAPASTVLAFSVGMQFAITLTSVLAGGAAIWGGWLETWKSSASWWAETRDFTADEGLRP